MSSIKTLSKNALLYTLCNTLIRIGEFYIKILINIKILTAQEYAAITEVYRNYISFFGIIYTLSISIAYYRFAAQLGEQHVFNTILTIIFPHIAVLSIVIVWSAPYLKPILHYNFPTHYFYYIVIITSLDTLLELLYARLRIHQNTTQLIATRLLQSFTYIGCIILLFHNTIYPTRISTALHTWLAHNGLTLGNVDGILMANILSCAVALAILHQKMRGFTWHLHLPTVHKLLNYSAYSFIHTLCMRLHTTIIPTYLFLRLTPDTFYYPDTKIHIFNNLDTALKLTVLMSLAIQSFEEAAEPLFFSKRKASRDAVFYSHAMHFFIVVASVIFVFFGVNIDWIAKIAISNPAYRHLVNLVPYLAFIQVLLGIYYNLNIPFKLCNKMPYNGLIDMASCCVVGLTAWYYMPRAGHWGYVYATLAGAIFLIFSSFFLGKKLYPIPYKLSFALLPIGSFMLLHFLSQTRCLAYRGYEQIYAYVVINATLVIICGIAMLTLYRLKKYPKP